MRCLSCARFVPGASCRIPGSSVAVGSRAAQQQQQPEVVESPQCSRHRAAPQDHQSRRMMDRQCACGENRHDPSSCRTRRVAYVRDDTLGLTVVTVTFPYPALIRTAALCVVSRGAQLVVKFRI